jgi:hypothetical protein
MHFFDIPFWQGFIGNLFATIIGVIVGIPVAFWINKRVEVSTEREKKKKILVMLSTELTQNKDVLVYWQERKQDYYEGKRYGALLRDEIWHAFSDGGEIQWIKDMTLLGAIANAYGEVKHIKYLYETLKRLYESDMEWNPNFGVKLSNVTDELWSSIQQTQELIEEAQGKILIELKIL